MAKTLSKRSEGYVRAKKSLGQHFLMHARIAERIMLIAGVTPDTIVFEIGPGTGILTRELLKTAKKVIALEADQELYHQLQTTFEQEISSGHLELLLGDVRTFDPATLSSRYMIVANIPYYVTGEIIRLFLSTRHQPEAMTLLVQKEVAERIARSKKESILSLSVKVYGVPKYEFTIPRGAFRPAPKVDSAVLSIRNISRSSFLNAKEEETYFALLHAGFAHKRKFVATNLAQAGFLTNLIPDKARAEDISLENWLHVMHFFCR